MADLYVVLLALAIVAIGVLAAELTRSACRRQLMAPVRVRVEERAAAERGQLAD